MCEYKIFNIHYKCIYYYNNCYTINLTIYIKVQNYDDRIMIIYYTYNMMYLCTMYVCYTYP